MLPVYFSFAHKIEFVMFACLHITEDENIVKKCRKLARDAALLKFQVGIKFRNEWICIEKVENQLAGI